MITKSRKHEESDLQQTCVTWFKLKWPQYWLISIKNSSKMGGKTVTGRNGKQIPLEAIIAKREGLRKGVADLQLLYGNGLYYSLFIELKTKTGSQSAAQKEFALYCLNNHFKYVIVRNLDEFIDAVNQYIEVYPHIKRPGIIPNNQF